MENTDGFIDCDEEITEIAEIAETTANSLKASKLWSLLFFPAAIIYCEVLFKALTYKKIGPEIYFIVLLSLSIGLLFYFLSTLSKKAAGNRIAASALSGGIGLWFGTQYVYYRIFHIPLSVVSVSAGVGQIAGDNNFTSFAFTTIFKSTLQILMFFLPLILLLTGIAHFKNKINMFEPVRKIDKAVSALAFSLSYALVISVVIGSSYTKEGRDDDKIFGQYFTSAFNVELSQPKFGVLTNLRLDLQHLFIRYPSMAESHLAEYRTEESSDEESSAPVDTSPNVMAIDFESLIQNETDGDILSMHKYFSETTPSNKNKYTGIYQGYNLIYLVCEGFSYLAVDPEITPTLYKLANEGFVFENAYTPIWGVSTSDGEYVACQSLIPKSGVWSFWRSRNNWLPFTLGNLFLKNYDCMPRAYHDHTYDYYDRDESHPNLGYVYKAVGNGLEITKSWPESDLEMMQVTIPEYINDDIFHAYYMTVSGHLQYSFADNAMAYKNKQYVDHLPYSSQNKAYLACNIELDRAIEYLISQLEAAGKLENTVIVMSADHYPYGLTVDAMSELAGRKIDTDFEIYKNQIIIWNCNQEKTVVSSPVSSMDLLPTVLNMFGFEYDSRLLMGRDVFGGTMPLVIFNNRSFITDKVYYNAKTGKATSIGGEEISGQYISGVKNIVSNRFYYSALMLDRNYFNYVLPKDSY